MHCPTVAELGIVRLQSRLRVCSEDLNESFLRPISLTRMFREAVLRICNGNKSEFTLCDRKPRDYISLKLMYHLNPSLMHAPAP